MGDLEAGKKIKKRKINVYMREGIRRRGKTDEIVGKGKMQEERMDRRRRGKGREKETEKESKRRKMG